MPPLKRYLSAFQTIILVVQFVAAQPSDRAGCEDHPLISRYSGSVLAWCDEDEFSEYHIAIGPQTGYRHIDDWLDVRGQVFRLYYTLQGDRTVTEVYYNYRNAHEKAGMSLLASGLHPESNVSKEVGGRTWLGTAYAANPLPSSESINLFHGTSTSAGAGYMAAELSRPEGSVYVVVMVYQHSQSEVLTMIDIIESAPMDNDLVSVDADYMARQIDSYGKVAVYGLFFDYDRATLTEESSPALQEIGTLLTARPDLNLYVVGHTDMDGSLGYNLELSERRAQSVIDALVHDYGIAGSRLEAHGVGPLVPVRSNQQEAGKAENRRVELVQR